MSGTGFSNCCSLLSLYNIFPPARNRPVWLASLWIRVLPPIIKTREQDETSSTALFLWRSPRDLRCPRLRGVILRYLFDVKVEVCSLFSTGSLAAAWPGCNSLWSEIYYSLLRKGLRELSHLPFQIDLYFWFLALWDKISLFQFIWAIYYSQYIISHFWRLRFE